jgi:hypothetical protein
MPFAANLGFDPTAATRLHAETQATFASAAAGIGKTPAVPQGAEVSN